MGNGWGGNCVRVGYYGNCFCVWCMCICKEWYVLVSWFWVSFIDVNGLLINMCFWVLSSVIKMVSVNWLFFYLLDL